MASVHAVEDDNITKDTCACLRSVITAVKYHKSLDSTNNEEHQDKLNQYCRNECQSLLDDCIEVIIKYNDSLDSIFNQTDVDHGFNCDMKTCPSFKRYNVESSNEKRDFYMHLLDKMHCYLTHTWDLGLRVKISDIKYDDDEDQNKTHDKQFSSIHNEINKKKQILKTAFNDAIKRFENKKYNLQISHDTHEKHETFLDELYNRINATNKQHNVYIEINEEEYDTDAIILEIDCDIDSTLIQYMQNTHKSQMVYNLVRQYKIEQHSFSIGYTFYYWDFYKHNYNMDTEQHFANRNDMLGYQTSELFVEAKHHNMKEEVLKNGICCLTIKDYEDTTIKCQKLMFTKKAKSMKSVKVAEKRLHYIGNKSGGQPILYQHIFSVILYCDWTYFQAAFSSTFRPLKPFEPLKSIKKRHSEYALFGKYLREIVEYYGCRGRGDKVRGKNKRQKYINKVTGPFYCGMNRIMAIPSFNIRICGATSTSRQIQVATRFTENNGMIIQFNNNGDINGCLLRMLPCNWISKYPEEDEYLLIGGQYCIKIESIRTMDTDPHSNYQSFCRYFFHLDCMIKGTAMKSNAYKNVKKSDYQVLNNLIQYKLGIGFGTQYVKYVYDLFDAFTHHQTQIVLNLHQLDIHFKKSRLKYLIVDYKSPNLFKDIIFQLFENIKHIILYTTNHVGSVVYKIDLLELLKRIPLNKTNLRITIKARRFVPTPKKESWLCDAFRRTELQFKTGNYHAILKQTNNEERGIDDCLFLQKL